MDRIQDFIHRRLYENLPWEKNKEVITKELDKCVVLCANCHREEHHK